MKSSKKYLYLGICHMTRKLWAITSSSQTKNDMIKIVEEILKEGKPKMILCDRYSAMKSKKFREFLEKREIRLEFICTDSPGRNGTI